jgi:glycolate oxidase iron-sulfur subunit
LAAESLLDYSLVRGRVGASRRLAASVTDQLLDMSHSSTTAGHGEGQAVIPYERFLDCVHCGLCTSACPTYLETGDENDSPRGRIYLMRAVSDGRLAASPEVIRHLDLCLDCRSCETACPSGVQYGRLIEPFRASLANGQIPASDNPAAVPQAAPPASRGGWFERWILHRLFPYPRRLRFSLMFARWSQRLGIDRLADRIGLTKLLPMKLQRMQRLLPPLSAPPAALPERLPALEPVAPGRAEYRERKVPRARVALFTGCVADAMFRPLHWATARVLQVNGCEIVTPRSQVCCGAIHYHSGSAEPALGFARQNVRSFPADIDAVIVNVAGCGSMLKDYPHMAEESAAEGATLAREFAGFSQRVRDVSEFLAALGLVPPPLAVPLTVAYHDACHLCHAQRIREQPRQLLQAIPGLTLVPLAESDICCGAAGSYNLTEPEMADRLGRRKVENILRSGASAVVSANAGCTLQIQALLRTAGADIPVLHPVELLARAYGVVDESGYSRARLPADTHQ